MNSTQNKYGPPNYVYLIVDLNQPQSVPITLRWTGKRMTRLPEAMWLSFTPAFRDYTGNFFVQKIGQEIPANNVLINGVRHTHGHWGGVNYQSFNSSWNIDSLDVSVVSLGLRSPFPPPLNATINFFDGVHFLLWNNIWSTNFPLWYPFNINDQDAEFRFTFTSQNLLITRSKVS